MSSTGESSSGLSHVLSKNSRRSTNRKAQDRFSIASTESEDRHGIRASIEGAVDKLKHRDGADKVEDSSGLSKLMPNAIKSKRRRKKQEKEDEARASEEAARGRAVAERGRLDNDDANSVKADDASSLITYESETESLVHQPSDPVASKVTSPTRLAAQPASASSPILVTAETLQAPNDSSKRRSPSPLGKIREVLNTRRDYKSNPSPEREVADGTLGARLVEDGSPISRRASPSASPVFAPGSTGKTQSNSTPVSQEPSRTDKGPLVIVTDDRPNTPPTPDRPAPVIVNTPPTPTEKSAPQFANTHSRGSSNPIISNPNVIMSASGNMISHRRTRTNSSTVGPSKLSNITSAPLTPTLENMPNNSTGFFSSVFSAAQNAASTLSNSIANTTLNTNQTRSRSSTQDTKEATDVEVETVGDTVEVADVAELKEPAVRTLGMGDLSLSHLGISEAPTAGNPPVSAKFSEGEQRGRSDSRNSEEPTLAGAHGVISDTIVPGSVDDVPSLARSRANYEPVGVGEKTPPNGSSGDARSGIIRSGSIRSAIGSRRKRNSSAATGTTIGAAIAAANASVAHPAVQGTQPKITGFAVASKKRNIDFHQLFRSVPDDDYLIEDFSCALQREILAHGRLYVSEGHLCFSSNIFGWVTTLVMSFDEIVSVEKRNTALVFKNGLMISTLHAKNIFASFTSRDSTYDLIIGIWKLGHPSLRSSVNGVRINETGGDKTEKDDGIGSQSGSGSEDESEEADDIYDEDEDEDDGLSFTQAEGSVAGSEVVDRTVTRKPSTASPPANSTIVDKVKDVISTTLADFPGPASHSPTDCSDHDTHYDKMLADELIPAPLGKVYNLVFGPGSVTWMTKWLTVEQKCMDLQMEDKKGLTADNKMRAYSYIKPLNGSIGPRQTKCLITETLDSLDLEKAVSITSSTQTPDVPSGNVFTTKTKYCLTWGEGNTTRLQMNCSVEWTGKSWLKGPIEKGANDGQVQFAKDLVAALKVNTLSNARALTVGGSVAVKTRKKSRKGGAGLKADFNRADGVAVNPKVQASEDWGMLEPIRPLLGPLVELVKPLTSGHMIYGLIIGLLVATLLRLGRSSAKDGDLGFLGTPQRLAAYEEIWRREESELWDWLEERVGMEKMAFGGEGSKGKPADDTSKSMEEKLREEKITQREMEIAIQVTEEKLNALKRIVGRPKAGAPQQQEQPKEHSTDNESDHKAT
ncbi:MAG: hypothetical protein M1818_007980 [Claussenomyces sp. TS43310]|nr:MAG: hypothetical protein M1818_007980 [Claussenomyces sp. TS43310]